MRLIAAFLCVPIGLLDTLTCVVGTRSLASGAHRVLKERPASYLQRLLVAPPGWDDRTREQYWEWLDKSVLAPVRASEPALYDHMVELPAPLDFQHCRRFQSRLSLRTRM